MKLIIHKLLQSVRINDINSGNWYWLYQFSYFQNWKKKNTASKSTFYLLYEKKVMKKWGNEVDDCLLL